MRTPNKTLITVTITVLVIGLLALGYYFFYGRTINPTINSKDPQHTEVIKVNDSINILKQRLYLAENRKDLVQPTETVIQEALRHANISANDIMLWKSIYSGKVRTIEMKDSFNGKIQSILDLQKSVFITSSEAEKTILRLKYEADLAALLKLRMNYSENTKYRKLDFNYGLDNKVNITKDSTIIEPFVVFGEKNKFLGIGKSEYSVVVGDKNPNVTQTSAFSSMYKPRNKVQIGFGPIVLANKTHIDIGAGITLKKGIFSLTLGYSLINK